MEFTGTPSGLNLAGALACAHGRVGVGGFHNDCDRTVDFKLWNMKAITFINCHERRIEFETELCRRGLDLISKEIWKFTGATRHIYSMEEFDKANCDMKHHTNNFIKGADGDLKPNQSPSDTAKKLYDMAKNSNTNYLHCDFEGNKLNF